LIEQDAERRENFLISARGSFALKTAMPIGHLSVASQGGGERGDDG
jgi:hypothetical protein